MHDVWRQRDDDAEQWIYLERMQPGKFSYEVVKQRGGGGAYRIRLFGAWDRARRQEKYITQVAFWIWDGFPPTPALGLGCGARSAFVDVDAAELRCGMRKRRNRHRHRDVLAAMPCAHQAVVSWNEPTP